MQTDLSKLKSTADYVASRKQIFPSASAFEWFVRQHREQLVSAGALSRPHGRILVHEERCDQVVVEVGQARMVEAA